MNTATQTESCNCDNTCNFRFCTCTCHPGTPETRDPLNAMDLEVTENVDPRNLPPTFTAIFKKNDQGRSAGLAYKFIVGSNPRHPDPEAVAKHRNEQRIAADKRNESFERCDTDGFLSQRCHDLNSSVSARKAEIAADGGYAVFLGLFDRATGERVPAVLCDGEYGSYWRLCDPKTGRFLTGSNAFINDTRGPRGAVTKRGFVVLGEWATANAKVGGSGRGLSGLATAHAVTYRTDGGYPTRPR